MTAASVSYASSASYASSLTPNPKHLDSPHRSAQVIILKVSPSLPLTPRAAEGS